MVSTARRVMIIGVDSAIAPRVFRWAKEGKLPVMGRLISSGVWAANCLAPLPTITPPNWTSIATGAWAGTHGITDYMVHVPGEPLNKVHNAFDIREWKAEPLWDAAARAGKHAVVVNWPSTWPPQLTNGCQIGGSGLAPTDWQFGLPVPYAYRGYLAVDAFISTEDFPYASRIDLHKAKGWSGLEHSPKALEADVTIEWRRPRDALEPVTWHILVDSQNGQGYDTVVVASQKDRPSVIARLRAGQWSSNLLGEFNTSAGPQKAVFKMKVVELSPDAQRLRLYVVGPCALHGWGYPESIEDEFISQEGLPIGKAAWEWFAYDAIDADTLVETWQFHDAFLVDASLHLLRTKPWDVFLIHLHATDFIYHYLTKKLDPLTADKPEDATYWQEFELRIYQNSDRTIGRLLEAADDDTLVVITSDHGAKTETSNFNVNDVLEAAGLLTFLEDEGGQGTAYESGGINASGRALHLSNIRRIERVDWSKTKAIGQRWVHVYVNLKGRDPDGIVEPGEEYERIVTQIIDALYTYVDPNTGKRPVALALRREDARIIGHYSEMSGDVIYAINPDFGREHGHVLTTARYGIGDLRALLIMSGPGVRKGEVIERNVWLTDIVPTVCYLTGLPVPAQAEGGVLYQALEDPDAPFKELESSRRNVERLKRMVERPPMC